ncbi:twitching motility protein PilU [Vreelandella aquamarina]|uniref:Twitching motility protein PilU n=1 Tax=Vreelandella aquamarina TaxID=77097 RepID=A0A1N6D809_9GAMM|nr:MULTISPECIES: PilT/PilU family type 4a pilus ATPase [Halomonas]SIN60178.1 twitching motility protein PilU [Halomonas meridiana]SIN66919.1 twitching motility protein PilU [Halomonas meridiana]SIO32986.1 twitching motility protein PilU [Halomonas meridiana]BCA90575.1 twitching motility protein PilU [Halomonas meridiana]BCB72443.1 twitching motility protein PilU [Halomonas meridiana]
MSEPASGMTVTQWLHQLLGIMVEQQASDLLISVGAPPSLKTPKGLMPLGRQPLSSSQVRSLVLNAVPEKQRERFQEEHEANFALSLESAGRFRVSAFQQRNEPAMVVRRIAQTIPTLSALGVPSQLATLANAKRGLVLVVGGTGTGKSTTLAAMIQERNASVGGHIITIEDPIEYLHPHQRGIVNQREVGVDTESFEVALKNTLRQAPDVILIGEVRTRETMEHALTFAETGHLCLATLHANNANQALERILHFFPHERHEQVLMDLSLNLRAVVAQQLLPTQQGGRCAAIEILLSSPRVVDLIRKGRIDELKQAMAGSRDAGMQTFDQALYALYQAGQVSQQVALAHADSANDLRLMIKQGDAVASGKPLDAQVPPHLALRDGDDY